MEKTKTENGVKITIHIPDKVSETTKQQKINRLYDILKSQKDKSA